MRLATTRRITSALDFAAATVFSLDSYLALDNARTTSERLVGAGYGMAALCCLGGSALALYNSFEHARSDDNPNINQQTADH